MTTQRLSLGKKGEKEARVFLEKSGYKIVASNYRTRSGEIDLIARDREVLVFVEVKTRSNTMFGSALEAITPRKQRQISKVAAEYLARYGFTDSPARFDVVAVTIEHSSPHVELVKNAFEFSYG
ncbi:MAG: YraN family protein [Desulfobulbaceae bacterium]|uniref:UPF0102 protein H8E41_00915 n=1 Tax=Candidatus Desulfobia pelagia TaxID=2841692 RepID=A0A8J6NCR6_9BACT|nr:YraN family protein [Candidatus Desulfobia pelagia]